jgi:endonuclease-3
MSRVRTGVKTATGHPSTTGETIQARKRRVAQILRILERTYPDTKLALNFTSPLELLIALILAAQCTDERVNQVTAELFPKYRTASDWAELPRERLEQEIRSTGFYRNKAKAIQECCQSLIAQFNGRVPATFEELIALPGVGRKTANILLGNAFGKPAIGVDTHVGRLAQRLGLSGASDPDKIELDLNPLVPDDWKVRFCHLLQAHGRSICLARKPDCPVCPINKLCPYPQQAAATPARTRR